MKLLSSGPQFCVLLLKQLIELMRLIVLTSGFYDEAVTLVVASELLLDIENIKVLKSMLLYFFGCRALFF